MVFEAKFKVYQSIKGSDLKPTIPLRNPDKAIRQTEAKAWVRREDTCVYYRRQPTADERSKILKYYLNNT